jgi:hypothetical protein
MKTLFVSFENKKSSDVREKVKNKTFNAVQKFCKDEESSYTKTGVSDQKYKINKFKSKLSTFE